MELQPHPKILDYADEHSSLLLLGFNYKEQSFIRWR
jgi:hypothetical protein